MEAQSKYGTAVGTASQWFSTYFPGGLSASGRRITNPSAASGWRMGGGLSEAQFNQLHEAYRDGKSVAATLSSIGRGDIRADTVGRWFDWREDDRLSERGRSIRRKIQEDEAKAGR